MDNSVLQIRKDIEDNLKNGSNDGSEHTFLWKNMEKFL